MVAAELAAGLLGCDDAPVTLLAFGSVPVVQMDSSAGSGRLILFPGASQTIITGVTLTRRHTHSLILTFASGAGVNVWLDGTQVATGAHQRRGRWRRRDLAARHDLGRRRAVLVPRGGVVDLGADRRRHHDAAGLPDALDPGHAARDQHRWSTASRTPSTASTTAPGI